MYIMRRREEAKGGKDSVTERQTDERKKKGKKREKQRILFEFPISFTRSFLLSFRIPLHAFSSFLASTSLYVNNKLYV